MSFNRRNIIKLSIHIITWLMLIVFSLIITGSTDNKANNALTHLWLPIIEAATIFYLNYLLLIDTFIFPKRNYLLFILINLTLVLLFRLDMYVLQFFTGHDLHNHLDKAKEHHRLNRAEPFDLVKSLLGLIMPVLLALALRVTELWRKFELKKRDVENIQLQSELHSLKYQMQPHFFLNSLNNIYSLVDISPDTAQEAIHNLSKLMQYLLHDTNQEKVDLVLELNFLKKYIQLMELRQNEDVSIHYSFHELRNNQYTIAPLLLIPIIENAYKHGVSATHKSKIDFEITISNGNFLFRSSNPNFPKTHSDMSGSGIGLQNLRKRLSLIYPQKHTITTDVQDDRFYLTLTIQLL